jgi:hypothetical protein
MWWVGGGEYNGLKVKTPQQCASRQSAARNALCGLHFLSTDIRLLILKDERVKTHFFNVLSIKHYVL